jgi:hypothetical protein
MSARRPHLGERIAAVEHIRGGRATLEETAIHFGVRLAEVEGWIRDHADERTVRLDEFRGGEGELGRLARQAQRLRQLIARAERTLHALHAQFLASRIHT